MILVDKTILSEMENGNIVVKPFNREHLGTNSIDLTLNPKMLVYTNAVTFCQRTSDYQLISENMTDGKTYRSVYSQEGNFIDCRSKNETEEIEIPEEGYILQPGQLYIASTNEYTETHNAVPLISGKSSLGRLGLRVHATAGFGDVGFCGTWTLEIDVIVPLRIYPNMKICQVYYEPISEAPLVSYDKKDSAKYSGQNGATASLMHENFNNQ